MYKRQAYSYAHNLPKPQRNTEALRRDVYKRQLCALLIALFALDFCVSTLHPNTGQGIAVHPAAQDELQVIEPARIELLLYNLPN